MTPRARIVAAQTVVVGALVAVVFFTLLRPDDPQVLSGVQGPGIPGALPGAGPGPSGGDEDRDDGAENSGDGGAGGSGPGTGAAPPTASAQLAPAPVLAPADQGTPGDGTQPDETPTGQQYTSSLDQLEAKLD